MLLPRPFRRLYAMTTVVALLIAALPPLVFFSLEYRYHDGEITSEAQINARLVSELINKNPDLWRFEQLRLEELLGYRSQNKSKNNDEIREIFTSSGTSVARSEDALASPLISEQAPLFSSGRVVGTLHVTRSLRPLIIEVAIIAVISIMLGMGVFFIINTIPLRALRRAFADLEDEKERALITLQSIGDAVVTTDSQMRIQYLNPIAEHLIGWTTAEALGKPMDFVFKIYNEETRDAAVNPVRECLERNAIVEMENHTVLIRKTDSAEFHIEDSAAPIRRTTGEVIGAVMVFHDVSERKEAQKRLHHVAYHDALTSLPNRTMFHERLVAEISRARHFDKKIAVLFLDLDHFKQINDTLGHDIGDQLLIMVGKRLRKAVRNTDLIARMGGDEFTAILQEISSPVEASNVAHKIIDSIAGAFVIAGHELFVTTSIGIAFFPADGDNVDLLLKNADVAMYAAKAAGRNTVRAYTAESNVMTLERLQFEIQLHGALERGEFFLEYQPKLNSRTQQIEGMEALVRWRNPILGVVPPDRFISLLEESGKIVPVGEWVLRTAVSQARQWANHGFPITIAVNFSARQFQDRNVVNTITQILETSGLAPSSLEIEVTESMLMQNNSCELQLEVLSKVGIRIAMDDFGTGYSSLSYLRRFPINVLKVDKSFVQELPHDLATLKIVKTIIDLGHALNMIVVAEGVETSEQFDILGGMTCDSIQGYWVSRPMLGSATLSWLQSYQVRKTAQCA